MTSTGRQPAIDALIDADAPLRLIGTGYQFSEGPVWSTAEQCLYFSDIPGDTRWRWSDAAGLEVAKSPCFKANGLVLGTDQELVACDQVTSMVVRYRKDGRNEVLAFHHRGTYLNSPNDIVTRGGDGSLYFTDPDFGRWNDWIGQQRSRTMGYRGLYRVAADASDGEAELLVDPGEFDQPNGLCFSPDEQLLYVNDSPRAHIKVFDVAADGSLSGGRIFFAGVGRGHADATEGRSEAELHQELHDAGSVDGMKCDALGNVWVTGPRGVWVISVGAELLGKIVAPEVVGNLTWGGADLHTLFLMTTTTVHAVETLVGPAILPHHRIAED
jgi:gluconolactonase